MPSINLAHERFISEMILHGDRRKAYLAAYPACNELSAYNSACRLLSKPYVQFRIRDAVLATQHEVEQELKEHLREAAMSINDKRRMLALIARGQLTTTKTVVRYNREYTLQLKPQHRDILAAISYDMKLSNCWKREFDDDAF